MKTSKVCLEKVQPLLIYREQFAWHDVTWQPRRGDWNVPVWTMMMVLVSGGSRCRWDSMCTVWPLHSKWLSENNESASNFVLNWNIPLLKLFRWLRRPQLWTSGDWQLHYDHMPTHAPCLMWSFVTKHQIIQVTHPHYSQDLVPCKF